MRLSLLHDWAFFKGIWFEIKTFKNPIFFHEVDPNQGKECGKYETHSHCHKICGKCQLISLREKGTSFAIKVEEAFAAK